MSYYSNGHELADAALRFVRERAGKWPGSFFTLEEARQALYLAEQETHSVAIEYWRGYISRLEEAQQEKE